MPNRVKKEIVVSNALKQNWRWIRPLAIFVTSLSIVVCMGYFGFRYLYQQYFAPVDTGDTTPVTITLRGSVSTIAQTLKDNDLIRNAGVFKYYVDFTDRSAQLKAGEYQLSKNMTLDEIIETLAVGDGKSNVMTIRVIEGNNVEEIADSLVKQGALESKDRFLELCKDGQSFLDYEFIAALDMSEENPRKYMLEGYLFPDTYEIFIDSSEETIINKMLSRYQQIAAAYYERANELGMTMDEVTTLASLIEKEAKTDDFSKVSAVFHNRLNNNDYLQSCVTVQYVLNTKRLNLTNNDTAVDSPYNTYKNRGLPIGPITSPGENAIRAALYPDETFIAEGMYYFANKDPDSGELAFAKTLKEHNANVEQYKPLWEEADKKYQR